MTRLEAEQDAIVDAIGNIGKWQWLVILPLGLREIFGSWQMLSASFLAKEPDNYWCYNGNGTGKFVSLDAWQNFSSPALLNEWGVATGKMDKCNIYDVDYSTDIDTIPDLYNTRPCTEWVFPDNAIDTLITKFNLVCNRSWLITTAQVLYMVGVLCGAFAAGQSSDMYEHFHH